MTTKVTRNMLNTSIDDNGNDTAITIDSSENVGIATTSPSEKLTVTGKTQSSEFRASSGAGGKGYDFTASGSGAGLANMFCPAGYTLGFGTNSTERMRITSAGEVGIGTTTPSDYDNNAAGISSNLVVKDSGHSGIIVISGASSDAAISFGDGTGTAAYRGAVAYVNSADALYFKAGGNNKLRLDSDGLKFNLDTATANALNDYEEGTWTPAATSGIGITNYSSTYTKIGDVVMFRCYVQFSANSSSDSAVINGLPFTNVGSNVWCACSVWENNAKQPYPLVADGGESQIQLRKNANGAYHPYSDFSNTQVIVTGTYKTTQ